MIYQHFSVGLAGNRTAVVLLAVLAESAPGRDGLRVTAASRATHGHLSVAVRLPPEFFFIFFISLVLRVCGTNLLFFRGKTILEASLVVSRVFMFFFV